MSVLERFRIEGKIVIVTGASSGLGVAYAKGFAEAGARVVLAARRSDKLEQTVKLVESIGATALGVVTDVADPEQAGVLVNAAMAEFGQVDVLINNAGIGTAVPATRETPEQFRSVIDINLNGSYWTAQACGRVMTPGSSIINISSALGITTVGTPPGRLLGQQGGDLGPDPRSRAAVGGPKGHQGQRDCAGILRLRDDRGLRRWLSTRRRAAANPWPDRRPGRTRSYGHLAGVAGSGIRHRPDHRRRRWHHHLLTWASTPQ
jgi:hypothetical protein